MQGKQFIFCSVWIENSIKKQNLYTLDSGCHPDGTDYMEENGNCHCNHGFSGANCSDICSDEYFGTHPECLGNIFIQPKIGTLIVDSVIC